MIFTNDNDFAKKIQESRHIGKAQLIKRVIQLLYVPEHGGLLLFLGRTSHTKEVN